MESPPSLQAEMAATASPATPKSPPLGTHLVALPKDIESNQNPSLNADNEVSKKENYSSMSEAPAQDDNSTINSEHNQESSMKVKRCKHGRIKKIKDLQNRKHSQQSDTDANNTPKQKEESNNNNIVSAEHHHHYDNEIVKKSTHYQPTPSTDEQQHTISQGDSKELHLDQNQTEPQPHKLPSNQNEVHPHDDSSNKISSSNGKNHLTIRARARSRSISQSLSPQREYKKVRSPPRRSRDKSKRNRSTSRDRSRVDSKRRYDSSSPGRRSGRSRSSKKRKSRRQRLTPERRLESRSHRRRTPSQSSGRHLPRGQSITPPRHRNHRNSGGRTDERSKYDKYPHTSRYDRVGEPYDSTHHRRSPDNRRPRAGLTISADSYSSIGRNDHDDRPLSPRDSSLLPVTKSPLGQVLTTQHLKQRKLAPEAVQLNPSPKRSPVARSLATPSIDNSSSSDIYDPEAPVIPVSPGDSPPISPLTDNSPCKPEFKVNKKEKTGEDDVPSSAVQLNQQEKYLQKLNRQERVIEEVKVALRPFYQNRSINKEQYKDVLRRAVPKICHSKNGEINPVKIRDLVDKYVKKMKRQ